MATSGEKEIMTRYPITEGLTARTEKQTGRQMNLLPEGLNGVKTTVPEREKDLI